MLTIVNQSSSEESKVKLEKVLHDYCNNLPEQLKLESEKIPFAITEAEIEGMVNVYNSPWYRYFIGCKPESMLARIKAPMLALYGDRDWIVSSQPSLSIIADTCKASGNRDVTTVEFPNLNHSLQSCKTGALAEYGTIKETIASQVLKTISGWILNRSVVDYLDTFYDKTQSVDIGGLASEMSLLSDGGFADPAAQEDWNDSVNKILDKNPNNRKNFELSGNRLNIEQAYEAMTDFLDGYRDKTTSVDVANMLSDMKLVKSGTSADPEAWNEWNDAVEMVLKKNSESFEDGFDAKQAYEVGINFLDIYGHRVNSSEIIAMLDGMKLLGEQESKDPIAWQFWLESVNKTLNKYRTF